MTTYTTPSGTDYTFEYAPATDGRQQRWYMDDTRHSDPAIPVVLFIHGAGGTLNSDGTGFGAPGFYTVRNLVMDAGWAVLEADGGGPANWGGPTARQTYLDAFDWLAGKIDVGPVIVIGQSMGGIAAYWFATQSPIASLVEKLVIQNGTSDLTYRYAVADSAVTRVMNIAYGLGDTTVKDEAAFADASVGYDPMLFDTSVWAGKRVLQNWSTADTQVPPGPNGEAWVSKYGAHTAETVVHENVGGGHYVTAADNAAIIAFLSSTPPPPVPDGGSPYFYVCRTAYLVGTDRRLHLIDGSTV